MTNRHLIRVSLTGPDDHTPLSHLHELGTEFPFVEWALLYFPERQGTARNPSQAWRDAYWANKPPGYTALHLCGKQVFEDVLNGVPHPELARADRLQLNINARHRLFDDDQVLAIYATVLDLGPDLILQYHEGSAEVIHRFLQTPVAKNSPKVHVLLDASKGTGKAPTSWAVPPELLDKFHGLAGALGPDSIADALAQTAEHPHDFWFDMETNIRTNNQFDKDKGRTVLSITRPYIRPHTQ